MLAGFIVPYHRVSRLPIAFPIILTPFPLSPRKSEQVEGGIHFWVGLGSFEFCNWRNRGRSSHVFAAARGPLAVACRTKTENAGRPRGHGSAFIPNLGDPRPGDAWHSTHDSVVDGYTLEHAPRLRADGGLW